MDSEKKWIPKKNGFRRNGLQGQTDTTKHLMFPNVVFWRLPGKAGGLRVLHWFLLLVLHARVRNVGLIWLLQEPSHFLLFIRDWLHQCPKKKMNNSSEEKTWHTGMGGQRTVISARTFGTSGWEKLASHGCSKPCAGYLQVCVQAEQWGARCAKWIHGQNTAIQRTLASDTR